VFSGAGAAGIACAKLYEKLGVKRENMLLVDTKGVVYKGRTEGREIPVIVLEPAQPGELNSPAEPEKAPQGLPDALPSGCPAEPGR